MNDTTRSRGRLRGWHLIAAFAVAAVAVPIGIAGATHDSNTVHACVRTADGIVRIVSSSADCRNGEEARTWNEEGPAGPPGPSGPSGPAGPAGPAGASGGSSGPDLPPNPVAYLNCDGGSLGTIQGDATAEDHANWVEVVSYSHEVTIPTDTTSGSGMATGRRQHSPLVITKEIDRSSPLFARVLTEGRVMSSCELELVRQTGDGEETYFVIELRNARVAGVEQQQALPNTLEPTSPLNTEAISLTYQTIIWTWSNGGITTQDDWTSST